MTRPMIISFVIPVYRNRGTVRATYAQVVAMLSDRLPEAEYQFILVDDGSDDGSLEEILQIHEENPRVDVLSFSRNFGQVPAIVAGLRQACGDAVVILSADLQDPVELIADMIEEWRRGNHIVVCYRIAREDTLSARAASWAFYNLVRLSNPRMPSGGFDYILLDRQPARILSELPERNRFLQGDVLWLGFETKFIPYERRRRPVGKSQWTLWKKVKYFIDGLLSTSYLPIRFMSLVGTLTAFSGFLYSLVVVYIRLIHRQPYIGYAPIMIAILILGGVIMMMLGVIGEYVWRIYDETRGRPLYIIKESYGTDGAIRGGIPAGAGAAIEPPGAADALDRSRAGLSHPAIPPIPSLSPRPSGVYDGQRDAGQG